MPLVDHESFGWLAASTPTVMTTAEKAYLDLVGSLAGGAGFNASALATMTIIDGAFGAGSFGMKLTGGAYWRRGIGVTNNAQVIVGVYLRLPAGLTGNFNQNICQVVASSSAAIAALQFDSSGNARIATGAGNASSPFVITDGAWHYIELVIGGTATDPCQVYVDGVFGAQVANSGLAATTSAQYVSFHDSIADEVDLSDYYCIINTGFGTYNTRFGPVRVECMTPDGAGTFTGWTASSGSEYTCVDDRPPNGLTDYIMSSTDNDVVSFTKPNMQGTGTPKAVSVRGFGDRAAPPARTLALGTYYTPGGQFATSDEPLGGGNVGTFGPTFMQYIGETTPFGSGWTNATTVNSTEMYLKVKP